MARGWEGATCSSGGKGEEGTAREGGRALAGRPGSLGDRPETADAGTKVPAQTGRGARAFVPRRGTAPKGQRLGPWASCFSPLGPGHQARSFPHDAPRRSIIPLRQRGETEVTRPQPCSPSVGSAARTCDRGRVSPWPPRAARPSHEHERGVAPGCPAVPGRPLKQSLS